MRRLMTWGLMFCLLTVLLAGCTVRREVPATQGELHEAGQPAPKYLQSKPEWFGCKTDSDCVARKGMCDSWSAVNKNFLQDFDSFVAQMNPTLECLPMQNPPGKPVAGCVNGRCQISPARQTDTSKAP